MLKLIMGRAGAGKTTALKELEKLGGFVLDADAVYHEILKSNLTLQKELEGRFGSMLDERGSFDRKRLGAVVFHDPQALAETLRVGRLWGAALDVTEPEPLPADSPLWDIDNLILTPHVAGGLHLEGTRERIVAIALENLKHYLAGEPLKNRMK